MWRHEKLRLTTWRWRFLDMQQTCGSPPERRASQCIFLLFDRQLESFALFLNWWNTCKNFTKNAEPSFVYKRGRMKTCGSPLGDKDFLICRKLVNHHRRGDLLNIFFFFSWPYEEPFIEVWAGVWEYFGLQIILADLTLEDNGLGSSYQLNRLTQMQLVFILVI